MVQCEMCGTEAPNPNRVKIEGAELDVCDECTDFGTEVETDDEPSSTSTKYSTDSGSGGGSSGTSTTSSSGGGRRNDMFDNMEEVAQDYDEQIRAAREGAGLSQEELAKQLNEKASLIRKLEQGATLPSDDIQTKLERKFDLDLSASGSASETEWESDSETGSYTLGDVVERKDS